MEQKSKMEQKQLRKNQLDLLNEIAKSKGFRFEYQQPKSFSTEEKEMELYFDRWNQAFNKIDTNEMEKVKREFIVRFPNVDFHKMYSQSVARFYKQPTLVKIKL